MQEYFDRELGYFYSGLLDSVRKITTGIFKTYVTDYRLKQG